MVLVTVHLIIWVHCWSLLWTACDRCGRSHQSKKRARFEHGRWKKRIKKLAADLPKKAVFTVDNGPANGCHRNCQLPQIVAPRLEIASL